MVLQRPRFRLAHWVILTVLFSGAISIAVADVPARDDVQARLDGLARGLDAADSTLDQPWIWRSRLLTLRAQIETAADEAEKIHDTAKENAARQKSLIDALAPDLGDGRDSRQILKQRAAIESELTRYQAHVKSAALILAKAKVLKGRISSAVNRLKAKALLSKERSLFEAETWRGAGSELTFVLEWGRGLVFPSPFDHGNALGGLTRNIAVTILTLLVIAWGSFRLVMRGEMAPLPGNHLHVARRIVLHDLLPLGFALSSLWLLANAQVISRDVYDLMSVAVVSVAGTLIVASIVSALPRVAGGFDQTALGNGDGFARKAVGLSALVGVNAFLSWAALSLTNPPDLFWLVQFTAAAAAALVVATVMWHVVRFPGRERMIADASSIRIVRKCNGRAAAVPAFPLWFLPMAAIVADPVIFALGYKNLAEWLFFGIFGTVGLLLLVWFASTCAKEVVPLMLKRWIRPAFVLQFGRRFSGRRMRAYRFWILAVVQSLLWGAAAVAVLLLWGVQPEQLFDWAEIFLADFKVGTVTISLVDIAAAIAAFLVMYFATRIVQRVLVSRIFPHFDFDIGARNAIRSGVGYLGVSAAAIVAVLSLGVELTHIALIAGGLSVGIGFGLQAVANNFISGLIMLAERPIKEGDWVVVNDHEGLVKRVSFRATELQTFQKASVLIPNSELVSGTVTNWTFKDLTSRVDVEVGIPYDVEEAVVRNLLLSEARGHPRVLRFPEPQVNLRGFGDGALIFELWAYIQIKDVSDKHRVESELRIGILAALRANGIEIPSPKRDIRIDGRAPVAGRGDGGRLVFAGEKE